jgi:hypothetical protein
LSAKFQEKEINLLRDTHSRNILTSTDGSAAVDHIFLGREGQDFKFAHINNKVLSRRKVARAGALSREVLLKGKAQYG